MRRIVACLALLLCTASVAARPAAQARATMPANDLHKVRGMMREAYEMVKKKQGTLILDLRGNSGGLVNALHRMVANVFSTDVTIGTRVGRNGRATMTTKGRGDAAFTGTLIVLVDSASGSSAEIFARTLQLQKRTRRSDRRAGALGLRQPGHDCSSDVRLERRARRSFGHFWATDISEHQSCPD